MESPIAEFLVRKIACELLPTFFFFAYTASVTTVIWWTCDLMQLSLREKLKLSP